MLGSCYPVENALTAVSQQAYFQDISTRSADILDQNSSATYRRSWPRASAIP